MKTTHAGMGITESDWNLSADHLEKTLEIFKVPEKETKEVLDIVASLKTDIVEK